MIDLPPEIIIHILTYFDPKESSTIKNLLNLTSLSKSFAEIALQSSLWIPIATKTWLNGTKLLLTEDPHSYVRSRSLLDSQARKSLNSMIESSSGNLMRLEMINILGDHVIDRLLEDRIKIEDKENYLSRRYWANESIDNINRSQACTTWQRLINQEEDLEDDVEDGLLAFEAFRGDRDGTLRQADTILCNVAAECSVSFSSGTPASIALQLCQSLTNRGIKRASPTSFHAISNSFLSPLLRILASDVILPNRGTLPLTLVVLFCSIIRRLDPSFNIQAKAINFPGVVLAALAKKDDKKGEEDWTYIDVADGGKIMTKQECSLLMERMGLVINLDLDLKPCRASDMCLRISRNLLRSIREAQQGQQEANSIGFTSALYAAATALYFLSPPDPNSPYLVWITPIIQAEFPSDVTRLENFIIPNLDPLERKKMLDLCDSIREEDSRIKELKIRKSDDDDDENGLGGGGGGGVIDERTVKWKIGHVFRHRLFGYCAVIRGYDFTCMASEEWIDAMQVNRLTHGRHQPFYHVIVEDGTSRYVASENITEDNSVDEETYRQFEKIHLIGRYFRKRGIDINGRECFIQSPELAAVYPEGT